MEKGFGSIRVWLLRIVIGTVVAGLTAFGTVLHILGKI
jgi:hypothetical protein